MTDEGLMYDRKSLRILETGMPDLAKDCVAFANARGGSLHIGVEDGQELPPVGQRIPSEKLDWLSRRISQLTINVAVIPRMATAENGGEYVELQVLPNSQSIASTTKGQFYIRVGAETRPLMPEDLARLMSDKTAFVWETQSARKVSFGRCDPDKKASFLRAIRASDRVSPFVREMPDYDLLEYYFMVREERLTNLGILWIGLREDRATLLYPPTIQCIKHDEKGRKIEKWDWDDSSLNPMELIEAVWASIPDWKESYEIPDGMFRARIPHYPEIVVRELLVNALVHRPYTTRGDIFINLHPTHLEIHNPGRLPLGVTPHNILHRTVRRNDHLAKVFYDLKLMEREGSGFDQMYAALLGTGRPAPEVSEGDDRVVIRIEKQLLRPEITEFMQRVSQTLQPPLRQTIALGLLAMRETMSAADWAKALSLRGTEELKDWIGDLRKWGLVNAKGRARGMEYSVNPSVLKTLNFKGATTLRGIEDHRLRELVIKDLQIYGESSRSDIRGRIGPEITQIQLRRIFRELIKDGTIQARGERRWRKYLLNSTP